MRLAAREISFEISDYYYQFFLTYFVAEVASQFKEAVSLKVGNSFRCTGSDRKMDVRFVSNLV
ncbi:MAG TPA: hypothetical protein QF694_07170, partial [Dehalococcoidia bacterium]|nr:hypothetical protein [Dehalococcoidia bacterium]